MPAFNNKKDFDAYLLSKVKETMWDDVVDAIRLEQYYAIETVVYKSYYPRQYSRRRSVEGLQDYDNMIADYPESNGINKVRVKMENITRKNTDSFDINASDYGYLTPLIVYGHGGAGGKYSWGDKYPHYGFTKKRDFVKETRNRLRDNKTHIRYMKIGLDKRGVDVNWLH